MSSIQSSPKGKPDEETKDVIESDESELPMPVLHSLSIAPIMTYASEFKPSIHSTPSSHKKSSEKDPKIPHEAIVGHPFVLKKLNNRIKKCQGCRQNFRKPIIEPEDLVVAHKDKYSYYSTKFQKQMITQDVRHYHASFKCIKALHPNFHPSSLVVPPNFKLTDRQIQYLIAHGINLD